MPVPSSPRASVVIPAYEEEAVIGRCLRTLLDGTEHGELEVVVVPNGCTDRTAEVAAAFPGVLVSSLPEGSKHAALNHGDALVSSFPRIYLDADVEVTADAVRRVVEVLSGDGVACAAPRIDFDLDGCSWPVRRFHEAFLRQPYVRDGLIGLGFYALSAAGRGRFDRFPELTADDLFVRNLFAEHERAVVDDRSFVVRPARRLRELLRVRTRSYRGLREYQRTGHRSEAAPTRDLGGLARQLVRHPLDTVVYVAVNLWAMRCANRSSGEVWERDDSSR